MTCIPRDLNKSQRGGRLREAEAWRFPLSSYAKRTQQVSDTKIFARRGKGVTQLNWDEPPLLAWCRSEGPAYLLLGKLCAGSLSTWEGAQPCKPWFPLLERPLPFPFKGGTDGLHL